MNNIPSHKIQKGKRILCLDSGKIHLEQEEIATFEFADYSWECTACGGIHCSQCFYESDGETITVTDCGRFDYVKDGDAEEFEKFKKRFYP